MSVQGIFTNIGIEKSREALNSEGFKIFPTGFKVSSTESAATIAELASLTAVNGDVWYSGDISATFEVDYNSVKIVIEIPPEAVLDQRDVAEVYLMAEDVNQNEFILAVGKPTNTNLYNPAGSTTLRLQIKLLNNDLSSILQFNYTQAQEISIHNEDANAHAGLRAALKKGGIYELSGDHTFHGQSFDEFATGGDGRSLFAGLPDKYLVFLDTDDVYKPALNNGTLQSRVAGILVKGLDQGANPVNDQVVTSGFIDMYHGFPYGTPLFLSKTTLGGLTDEENDRPVGMALSPSILVLNIGEGVDVDTHIDAVVSDLNKHNHFARPQDAIDFAPEGGWVRIDKEYYLEEADALTTNGKKVNFLFTGTNSGILKFDGQNEIQRLDFSSAPNPADGGEFLITFDGERTARIPTTATAADLKVALEALPNITSVDVTGDFSLGFEIEWIGVDQKTDKPQVEVTSYQGRNDKQIISFSHDDFDSGSFRLELNGEQTAALPFTAIDAPNLQSAILGLPSISSATVNPVPPTQGGALEFLVEFTGANGNRPQNLFTVDLNNLVPTVNTNIFVTANIIKDTEGEWPDNNLVIGTTPVTILTTTTQEGKPVGSDTAFSLDVEGLSIIGLGRIFGFTTGVHLNSNSKQRIELFFDNIPTPINSTGVPEDLIKFDGSLGISNLDVKAIEDTSFRDLVKVKSTNTPSTSVEVTSAVATLSDGAKHGFIVDQRVASYAGGTINFSNGQLTGAGSNFTPYTATSPNHYFKYAIILNPADEIEVILPTGDAGTEGTAPVPPIRNGILRAIVTCQDDGAGGLVPISPSMITHFFDTGSFAQEFQNKVIETIGAGAAVFDTSSDFNFDADNDVRDLEVFLDGLYQQQKADGTGDYRKISSSEIEFTDGEGGSFNIQADSKVTIKYKDSTIDNFTTGQQQVGFNHEQFTTDGIQTEFVLGSEFNLNTDNAVNDVEIYVDGIRYRIPDDFTKIANDTIESTDVIPQGSTIDVYSREFTLGQLNTSSTFSVSEDNVEVEANVGDLNITGISTSVTKDGSGQVTIDIAGEANQIQMVGVGNGEILKEKSGVDFFLRKIRAGAGIAVSIDNETDDIVISMANSPYFLEYVTNQTGLVVSTGQPYDMSTRRLHVFRNGLHLLQSATVGDFVDRYVEDSEFAIRVFEESANDDVWQFLNRDRPPVWVRAIGSVSGNTITVPPYVLGADRVCVFRNGVFMNRGAYGSPVDRFSEIDSTTIGLEEPATPDETFIIEFQARTPTSVEVQQGVVGNTLTLANPIQVGTKRLLLFKNGILMLDSTTLGDVSDRYQEINATTIELGENAVANDYFMIIYL
jgi:hypothetical protein